VICSSESTCFDGSQRITGERIEGSHRRARPTNNPSSRKPRHSNLPLIGQPLHIHPMRNADRSNVVVQNVDGRPSGARAPESIRTSKVHHRRAGQADQRARMADHPRRRAGEDTDGSDLLRAFRGTGRVVGAKIRRGTQSLARTISGNESANKGMCRGCGRLHRALSAIRRRNTRQR
jgi:hypothetical protein